MREEVEGWRLSTHALTLSGMKGREEEIACCT